MEENSRASRGTSDQIQVAEDTPKETQPSEEEEGEEGEEEEQTEKQTEQQENVYHLDPDDQNASLPELDVETEVPPLEVESDTTATPDFIEADRRS